MTKSSRQFEILLPHKFNDGQDVPGEVGATTWKELRNEFSAVSFEPQTIQGAWLE